MFNKFNVSIYMLAVLLVIAAGCGKKTADCAKKADDGCKACGPAETKGEEKPAGEIGAMTPEQVMSAKCSHGLTYECAECRYEVGVVKVDPCCLKGAPGETNVLVQTVQVTRRKMGSVINMTGEIGLNENTSVHITPRISGVIHAVNVDIGAEVRKDDILFTVDSVELGQALSDYKKNLMMTELSRKNYEREKKLYENKVGAEAEMLDVQMKFEEYQALLKASEQKLHVMGLSESEIASVKSENSERLKSVLSVRAPADGRIIEKHAVTGELVGPGKDVMVLADLTTVWVWGGIYERDLARVLEHMTSGRLPVEIRVAAFPDRKFTGQVDYAGATMDTTTRTVKIRIAIENKGQLLRPGMFCEGQILSSSGAEVIAVPAAAVLSDEGVDFIFKHMKDDYYLRQNVKKGREFAGYVEILEGIEAGQTIVVEGAFLLKSDVLRAKMGAGCAD